MNYDQDSLQRRMAAKDAEASMQGAAEKIDLLPSPPPTYPGHESVPVEPLQGGGTAATWADKDVGNMDTPATPR